MWHEGGRTAHCDLVHAAAEAGDAEAQTSLAGSYSRGEDQDGLPRDPANL
jgi:hypothetical protein